MYTYIYIQIFMARNICARASQRKQFMVDGDFKGAVLCSIRIGYLVPRICNCSVFVCFATLRIEGCLDTTP